MKTDHTAASKDGKQGFSIEVLSNAPHRLLFFVGALNVLLATVWWLSWLANTRWQLFNAPQPLVYAGWLHALIMQYQLFPPFFFGFLLTVFPRWMGLKDFARWHYVPVGVGLLGGQVATVAGAAFGLQAWVHIGIFMTLAGWTTGLFLLAEKLFEARRELKPTNWHAWSCFAGMLCGLLGLLCAVVYMNLEDARWMVASIKVGTYALLVPIFFTVAHRMFPFFANNVVAGYSMWRPNALLVILWIAMLLLCTMKIMDAHRFTWLVEIAFASVTAFALARWWPRGKSPGLLRVLFIALAWLPISFALMGAQDVFALLNPSAGTLGRGPLHLLYIGCCGGLLVAMVTRVTQGHSGRMLEMPKAAWFAFVLVQLTAVLRLFGELLSDPMAGYAWAALLWVIAFLPWVARSTLIYLQPRRDGKPG